MKSSFATESNATEKAPVDTVEINGIRINQYESWCSGPYRIPLLADIIAKTPENLRHYFGDSLSIHSRQEEIDRMLVTHGTDDVEEERPDDFIMRLWNMSETRNGVEIVWTCFYDGETVKDGNVTGPRELSSGVTRLSYSKKRGWNIVGPKSR